MLLQDEFIESEAYKLSRYLNFKVIKFFCVEQYGGYKYLVFDFMDGSQLKFKYNHICEYEIVQSPKERDE